MNSILHTTTAIVIRASSFRFLIILHLILITSSNQPTHSHTHSLTHSLIHNPAQSPAYALASSIISCGLACPTCAHSTTSPSPPPSLSSCTRSQRIYQVHYIVHITICQRARRTAHKAVAKHRLVGGFDMQRCTNARHAQTTAAAHAALYNQVFVYIIL